MALDDRTFDELDRIDQPARRLREQVAESDARQSEPHAPPRPCCGRAGNGSRTRTWLLVAEAVRYDPGCPQPLAHPVPAQRGLAGMLQRAPVAVSRALILRA